MDDKMRRAVSYLARMTPLLEQNRGFLKKEGFPFAKAVESWAQFASQIRFMLGEDTESFSLMHLMHLISMFAEADPEAFSDVMRWCIQNNEQFLDHLEDFRQLLEEATNDRN